MAKFIIGSAWPYVQTVPHIGNMIGSVLSADVYARYLRMREHEVVFVSGSDMHGTPIEVEAIQLGVDPKEYAMRMHEIVSELFKRWNISFDLYTHTHSETHIEFVRKFFEKIYKNNYIFIQEDELPYCPNDKIFLPDRFIIGKCPYCGYERARGDQCERCGRLLEPRLLIEPKCAICGAKPEWRKTKHWYLDLKRLEEPVKRYVENNSELPQNAREMSLSILREGLKARAITRDNRWGIPAPFPGAEGKTIYVWFEAVLGYISAVKEYFEARGEPERWEYFWKDPSTKAVFFVGKDNIPFHVIILPALIFASGEGYTTRLTTSSTEYLTYEGDKISKSRRWGIWIDEALKLMPADYWRFVLVYLRPENRDVDFTWATALDIINKIMNDDVGNFVHRVLSFIKSRMKGVVPAPGASTAEDEAFAAKIQELTKKAEEHYERIELKDALATAVELAREGNRYLNLRAPWQAVKERPEEANTIMYNAYWAVRNVAIIMYPVVPASMERLWQMMGLRPPILWREATRRPDPGVALGDVQPLFRRIERAEFERMMEELKRLREEKWSKRYPWEQAIL